jgi:hypothetical protein
MGRTRDVSKILTANTSLLSLASASATYAPVAAGGLVKLVATSTTNSTNSATGTITFSAASSVSVNGCFTSTYESYLILVNLTSNSANDGDMLLRWRNAGTDSTASYYSSYTGLNTLASPGTINKTQDPSNNGHAIGKYDNSTLNSQYITIDVTNVFLSNFTTSVFKGFGSTDVSNLFSYNGGGNHRVSQSYDGFTLAAENGNFTGTMKIYGYRN